MPRWQWTAMVLIMLDYHIEAETNGRHFADDMFKCISLNENLWIPIEISLTFVPKGSINNNPALFQIMAWHPQATSHYLNQCWLDHWRIYASLGLNELTAMVLIMLDYHIEADDIFKRIFLNTNFWIPVKMSLKFVPKCPINNIPALVQIMAWRRSGDKLLSEPMMVSSTTHIWVKHSASMS